MEYLTNVTYKKLAELGLKDLKFELINEKEIKFSLFGIDIEFPSTCSQAEVIENISKIWINVHKNLNSVFSKKCSEFVCKFTHIIQ